MKASEIIFELQSIMEDTQGDPTIDEYWLRVLLGIGPKRYLGKPFLKLVKEDIDNKVKV